MKNQFVKKGREWMKAILGKSTVGKKVTASVLALCVAISTVLPTGSLIVSAEGGNGTLNLASFDVLVGGSPVTSDTVLRDGDAIQIKFTWALDDSDRDNDTFIAPISPLTNIMLVNYPEDDLYVEGYGVVGKYSILDNQFKIVLDKDTQFYKDDSRTGWANIQGKINVSDAGLEDGDSVPYQIGTKSGTFTLKKDVTESSLSASKWTQGSVQKVGSDYVQTYRVKVNANNGDIKNIQLEDEHGIGLSNMTSLKVVESSSASIAVNTTYTDIATANSALSGITLQQNEYLTLEYSMKVDSSVYAQAPSWADFANKLKVTYDSNKTTGKSTETGYVGVSVSRPSLEKNGTYNAETGKATWTITIRLNDLKDADSFANLVKNIKDTPGTGFVGAGTPATLDPSLFTENPSGSGIYVYTYETQATEDYKNSISSVTLKNEIKADIAENPYQTTGQVTKPGISGILDKTFASFDEAANEITWKVTIHTDKLPSTLTCFTVCDRAKDASSSAIGSHAVTMDNIRVDGKLVSQSGSLTTDGQTILAAAPTNYYTCDVKLKGDYIQAQKAAGQDIVVTYVTKISDTSRENKTYYNDVYGSYVDPVTGKNATTPTVTAQWSDTSIQKNALEKTGAAVAGKNTIAYTIKVNTSYIAASALTPGSSIVLTDTLPDNMDFDTASFRIKDVIRQNQYYAYDAYDGIYTAAGAAPTSANTQIVTEGGVKKLKITILVTDSLLNLKNYTESSLSSTLFLQVDYTTTIADAKEFMQNGTAVDFTNHVTGQCGTKDIGTGTTTTVLTPSSVVEKSGVYDSYTAPNVKYTVEVNPQALDLSDGDLTAVDKLGSALSYNMDSICVYKNVSGSWQLLDGGYSVARNITQNSLTFTLPDSTYLKIEYTARVTLSKTETLTEENAFNSFALSGFRESVGRGDTQTVSAVIEPAVGGDATKGMIKLWKYWGSSESAHALDGCVFTIYETDEIVTGGVKKYVKNDTVFRDNIAVDVNGEVTIGGLTKDKVYALVEKTAKNGYQLNTVPYYFVIPSTEATKANYTGTNANIYTGNGPTLPFENQPDDGKGTLELVKTVTGDRTFEQVKTNITFTISGPDGYTKTVTGAQLVEAGNKIMLTGLTPGSYTVTETGRDAGGYTCSTTYQIGSGSATTGVSTTVTIGANTTNVLKFTNQYTQKKGSLTLKKTITSDATPPSFEAVKSTLSFVVTGPGGYTKTVTGAELDPATQSFTIENLTPGTYKIVESVGAVTGYSRIETKNEVKIQGAESGTVTDTITAGNVPVEAEKETTVTYTNNYVAAKGSIRLSKNTVGILFGEVKDFITFEIYKTDNMTTPVKTVQASELVDPGNSLDIGGLEPGDYVVKEKVTGTPAHYVLSATSFSVGGAAAVSGGETSAFSVASGEVKTVSFTNTYEKTKGKLRIQKSVSGASFEQVKNYLKFVVEGQGVYQEVAGSELTGTGNTFEITGLAPGNYTITEVVTAVPGYSLNQTMVTVGSDATQASSATFAIASDETTMVQFANTYEAGKGSIRLKKTTNGADFAKVKDKLSFTVTKKGTPDVVVKTVTGNELADAGNSLIIGGLEPGDYTVTETIAEGGDYKCIAKYYKVGSSTTKTGATTEEFAIASGDMEEVEFINAYEQLKGKLKLSKTISSNPSEASLETAALNAIRFTITGPNNYHLVVNGSDLTGTDHSKTIENLVPGTYIVTETTDAPDGYNLLKTEYTVGQTGSSDVNTGQGKIATLTIAGEKEATLTFHNVYAKKLGSLKLRKSVNGDATFETVKDDISFIMTYPDSHQETVKGTQLIEVGGTLTITNLVPGTYQIKEIVQTTEGYTCESTTHTVGSGTDATFTITGDQQTVMTFTNTYTRDRGRIRITKTLKGDVTEEEAKGALKFTVTDTATGQKQSYTLADFAYDATTGQYTLTLDEPTGTYEVEETTYDISGYVTDSVKYAVGTQPLADGTKATVAVNKNVTTEVAFEDTYTKAAGKLRITKTIRGDVTKEEAEGALRFTVTDTATNTKKTYTLKDFTYDAATGIYTLTLDKPAGTYEVEESITDIEGYVTSAVKYAVGDGKLTDGVKASVTIADGQTKKVAFEDSYRPADGKIVITKTIKGDVTKEEAEGTLQFTVTNTETKEKKTYTLKDFTYDDKTGSYTLTLDAAEGSYEVEETIYDIDGYVTSGVKYAVGTQTYADGTKAAVTLKKGETVNVAFEDSYTTSEKQPEKGKLVITKTLKGDIEPEEAEEVIVFRVTNTKTEKSKKYTLDDFAYNEETGRYTLSLKVEPGKYTVTETKYDVDGYETKSVTYSVNGKEAKTGTSASVTVQSGKTAKVAFTDTYQKRTATGTSQTNPPTTTTTTSSKTNRNTPKTGDDSPLMLWFALLLLGAVGTAGSIYGIHRKKKQPR